MRLSTGAVLIALLSFSFQGAATACSLVACIDNGPEFASRFDVRVKHDGRPLAGVKVQVLPTSGSFETPLIQVMTSGDGSVMVDGLAPGNYWLSVEFLGISAAYHCFHVAERRSRKAEKALAYEWGDYAADARHLAGRIKDSQPGQGGSPLWNIVHRTQVVISGAQLTLLNLRGESSYSTVSDRNGEFDFGKVTPGTYALHIEGGATGRAYTPTDAVIRVSEKGRWGYVSFERQEAAAGNCGFETLTPQWK